MSNPIQFGLNIGCARYVPIRKMAEIELHPRGETPLQRHLIDCQGWQPTILRRMIVIGRIEVCSVVGVDPQFLNGPTFATGKVFAMQAGKERQKVWCCVLVISIFDRWLKAGGDLPPLNWST